MSECKWEEINQLTRKFIVKFITEEEGLFESEEEMIKEMGLDKMKINFGGGILQIQNDLSFIPGVIKAGALSFNGNVYVPEKYEFVFNQRILYFVTTLLHEMIHVWQFHRNGRKKTHMFNVLWAFRNGYRNSKYEEEAYEIAGRFRDWLFSNKYYITALPSVDDI